MTRARVFLITSISGLFIFFASMSVVGFPEDGLISIVLFLLSGLAAIILAILLTLIVPSQKKLAIVVVVIGAIISGIISESIFLTAVNRYNNTFAKQCTQSADCSLIDVGAYNNKYIQLQPIVFGTTPAVDVAPICRQQQCDVLRFENDGVIPQTCSQLAGYYQEDCFQFFAKRAKTIDDCEGIKNDRAQASCFTKLARENNDSTLCQRVSDTLRVATQIYESGQFQWLEMSEREFCIRQFTD